MYRLLEEAPEAFAPTEEFVDARLHPAKALQTKQPYTYRVWASAAPAWGPKGFRCF